MRVLLQNTTTQFSPEATAGFILAFTIVGFGLVVLMAYAAFNTNRVRELQHRLDVLEAHPKLASKDLVDTE